MHVHVSGGERQLRRWVRLTARSSARDDSTLVSKVMRNQMLSVAFWEEKRGHQDARVS